jgi:cytosine deaminase
MKSTGISSGAYFPTPRRTAAGRAPASVVSRRLNSPDFRSHFRRIFELAREFGADIDMHLDSGNSAEAMDIHLICELTEQYGLGGHVAVGHMTKMSALPLDAFKSHARRLADVGVAVTVLPATDLFMMGRDQEFNVRRGVVDANLLAEHGVNCSISTNNVLNPFTPYGDGSLLRMANLHANVLQVSYTHRLAECFRI